MRDFFNIKFNQDVFLISTGNFFRILLVIAYSRLMTYFLDYDQLSKYYIVFSIYTFFSFIIIGSIGTYINRKTIEWVEDKTLKDGLLKLLKNILTPILIIAFFLVFFYSYIVYDSVNYSLLICLLVCSLILFKTSNESIYPIFNLLNLNSKYIFFLLLFNLLNLILSSLFVYFFDFSFQYWMLGLISSNFLIAMISWNSLGQEFRLNNKSNLDYKEIYSFSSSILVGHALLWLLTDGYRFIAENKFNSYTLGILLLGLVVASQIFAVIENLLSQLLYPRYLKNISNKTFEKRSEAFNVYLNKIIPIILFTAIFISLSPFEVLTVLVDSSKINNELILVFQIGLWIEFLRILVNTLKHITISEYKTSKIIIPYSFGAISFFAGIIFLDLTVTEFPLLLLSSYIVISISSLFLFNRIIRIKFNFLYYLKLILYLSPMLICLVYFKNITTLLISGIYLSLILYQLINNDTN